VNGHQVFCSIDRRLRRLIQGHHQETGERCCDTERFLQKAIAGTLLLLVRRPDLVHALCTSLREEVDTPSDYRHTVAATVLESSYFASRDSHVSKQDSASMYFH
jgi:hypothetical protein